jgi:palmitoyl-protein thioesterase
MLSTTRAGLYFLYFASALVAAVCALPQAHQLHSDAIVSQVRPLVLWHGMGDSHNSTGMHRFAERVKDIHPGIFVHSVSLADTDADDRRAGYVRDGVCMQSRELTNLFAQFGKVNEQLELVSQQLANISELRGGFDAIGFSQGVYLASVI